LKDLRPKYAEASSVDNMVRTQKNTPVSSIVLDLNKCPIRFFIPAESQETIFNSHKASLDTSSRRNLISS
jgi:hypothetical protein